MGAESGSVERDAVGLSESVVRVSWEYPVVDADAALAAIVATLQGRRPLWHEKAACRDQGHLDWHGPPGIARTSRRVTVKAMKAVCADCPVLDACTAWVTTDRTTDQLPGVLAGLTATQRRRQRTTSRSTDATT